MSTDIQYPKKKIPILVNSTEAISPGRPDTVYRFSGNAKTYIVLGRLASTATYCFPLTA